MKASSIVGWAFGGASVALIILSFQNSPNVQIIEAFVTVIKVLAGALGGAIAGEKLNG